MYENSDGLSCWKNMMWKANVVANILNHKSMGNLSYLGVEKREIAWELHQQDSLGVWFLDFDDGVIF